MFKFRLKEDDSESVYCTRPFINVGFVFSFIKFLCLKHISESYAKGFGRNVVVISQNNAGYIERKCVVLLCPHLIDSLVSAGGWSCPTCLSLVVLKVLVDTLFLEKDTRLCFKLGLNYGVEMDMKISPLNINFTFGRYLAFSLYLLGRNAAN